MTTTEPTTNELGERHRSAIESAFEALYDRLDQIATDAGRPTINEWLPAVASIVSDPLAGYCEWMNDLWEHDDVD